MNKSVFKKVMWLVVLGVTLTISGAASSLFMGCGRQGVLDETGGPTGSGGITVIVGSGGASDGSGGTMILGSGGASGGSGGVSASGSGGTAVIERYQKIAAGDGFTCFILSDRRVKCSGKNNDGQLGDGTAFPHSTPGVVLDLTQARDMDSGSSHSCVLLNDNTISCWGDNAYGQLGDGSNMDRYTPTVISGLSNVQSIASGGSHTCALLSTGTVKCWGNNQYGQLGDGTLENKNEPVSVTGSLSHVISITAGDSHTCALLASGTVKCWGYNQYNQLGDGTDTLRRSPVDVVGDLTNVSSIVAGGSHTCVLLASGTVKCWGFNAYGQLGDGTEVSRSSPVNVLGSLANVRSMTAGGAHTCALLSSGVVKCWGFNQYGQLGNGSTDSSFIPVTVTSLTSVYSVTAGTSHTCAVNLDNTVRCWGWNNYGQMSLMARVLT